MKFGQTHEHNITRRMALINICKLIRMSEHRAGFDRSVFIIRFGMWSNISYMRLFGGEVPVYFVSATYFHFCQRLRPRPVLDPMVID